MATKIADLGDGLTIELVDLDDLREQDVNARMMEPAMFAQLVANIKKRGQVEALPLCAVPEGSTTIEVVSGHHRTRAARAAGLKQIPCIVDRSGLNRSQIVAKQLAHNAISGFDDEATLKNLVGMIADVDDLLESWVGSAMTSLPDIKPVKIEAPRIDFDWRTVTLTFLPHQFEDFQAFLDLAGGRQDIVAVAPIESFDAFSKALAKYSRIKDVRNAGTAIALLTETALREIREAEELAEATS